MKEKTKRVIREYAESLLIAAVLALIILPLGLMMSACNKHYCPAYAQKDTEQTEDVG